MQGFLNSLKWALCMPKGSMWHSPIWHASCHLAATCAATQDPCHSSPIQCCRRWIPTAPSWLLSLVLWQMLGWKTLWGPSICSYQPGIDSNPPLLAKYNIRIFTIFASKYMITSLLFPLTQTHSVSEPSWMSLLVLTWSVSVWTSITCCVCHPQSSRRDLLWVLLCMMRRINSWCLWSAELRFLSEVLLVLGHANPRPLRVCTLHMITGPLKVPQRPRGVNGFDAFDDERTALRP